MSVHLKTWRTALPDSLIDHLLLGIYLKVSKTYFKKLVLIWCQHAIMPTCKTKCQFFTLKFESITFDVVLP